ncbi:protein chromatin remodeling 20 [Rhypophila decipiens]|uniref:Protein chromatin remodeling 20 n=1 Tax=Rhypophila decipiens TaxID=261697 RepID=A0AAN6YHE1_9PEZI|nr:protein chromatin remodeling 20 [Rhypophila decipiens]
MAGSEQDDPYDWDAERLAIEFSSPRLLSVLTPGRKLPDLASLAAKIREIELDGQTLLTYQDELGISALWTDLEIRKPPHKVSVNELIRYLKRHSPKYNKFKARLDDPSQSTVEKDPDSSGPVAPPPDGRGTELAIDDKTSDIPRRDSAITDAPNGTEKIPQMQESVPATHMGAVHFGPADSLMDTVFFEPQIASPEPEKPDDPERPARQETPRRPGEPEETGEPAPKKRKIVPTVISSTTVHRQPAFISSDADNLLLGTTGDILERTSGSSGYLGPHALRPDSITNPIFDPLVDNDDREFAWVNRRPRLPGRSVQVCRKMKRFLRDGPFTTDFSGSDASDPALPVFGESGDEDEADSVTWEEYQEEEQERLAKAERAKARKSGHLSEEKVREVVQQAIETLKADWIENKKPRKDREAWGKWRKAQLQNNRHALIRSEQKWRSKLERRIEDVTAEIVKTPWTSTDGLEHKARSWLDGSITDHMDSQWLIDVLQSPVPPTKPSKLPKLKAKPKQKPVDLGEDEEILTDDDFVVEDDDYDPEPMDIDPSPLPEDQIAVSNGQARAATPAELDVTERSETLDQQPTIKLENALCNTPRKVGAPGEIISIQDSPVKALEHVPDLLDIEAVAQVGAEYWAKTYDEKRLIVAILFDKSPEWRAGVFRLISDDKPDVLWDNKVEPAILGVESALRNKAAPVVDATIFGLTKLFNAFCSRTHTRMNKEQLPLVTWQKTRGKRSQFPEFCDLIKMLMPKFLPPTPEMAPSTSPGLAEHDPTEPSGVVSGSPSDEDAESSSDSSDNLMTFRKKKKKKKKRCDEKARDLQETTKLQAIEFDKRRKLLQTHLAQTGSVPSDKSRLIVNLTKESDDQALIYINEDIGRKIKDHQLDGVRFLWNHLVLSNARSGGGLLAHAMGLGKTMQVITLLVVIAESARSPDPSVRSQIPVELRESKTLIVSPAGLLENWVDEILSWAPLNLLGELFKLSADLGEKLRPDMIRQWASKGGLLVIGIELFTTIVQDGDEVAELLVKSPSIVVCDEAHILKNPTSQRHKAAQEFKTKHRIALTGSPLTKDIQDYYYMINWIAPGYLADHAEFKQRFEDPIKLGLFADSDQAAKRRARKQLHVLKGLVEPKVHRRDTDILRAELPTKQEFILHLPLTPIQMRVYEAYLDALNSPWGATSFQTQTGIWSLVANLTRLLAHPYIFKVHMETKIKEKKEKKKIDVAVADDIPEKSQSEIRALLRDRSIQDLENSNKILVLLKILDECKRIGDKVLVFSQSIDTLNYLQSIFATQKRVFQRLDGSTKVADRQNAIKKFNTDKDIEVYLISTRAGGVGFNIYGANRVVIFDTRYTPSDEKQAIGRAYRIGQTKPVTVYWLTTGGTYEDAIRNTSVFKTQLASRIVDKKNPNPKSNRAHEFRKRPTIPDKKDVSSVRQLDKVLDVLLNTYADENDEDCLIRSVTRTETFEEEENFELTAEDQLEAEKDLETERLRVTNPEEYKRREQEKWAALAQLASPSLPCESITETPHQQLLAHEGVTEPRKRLIKVQVPLHMRDQQPRVNPHSVAQLDGTSSPGPAVAGDGDGQTRASTANGNTVPEILSDIRPGRAPVPGIKPLGSLVGSNRVFASKTPSSVPGLSKSPTTDFNRTLQPQPKPVPSASSSGQTPATKPLEPILGKGTRYKEPSRNTAQMPSLEKAILEKEVHLLESLTRRADELRQNGRKPPWKPEDVVAAVNKTLNKRGINALPKLDKLQNLVKYIQDNPRFADGILSYHLQVRTVIDMDRSRLEKKSTEYRAMSEPDFLAQVWKAQGKPDVGNTSQPFRMVQPVANGVNQI